MPLRAYCEERFRITVSLGPGSTLGEKGKKRGQIRKNIGERSKPSAVFFFFFFFFTNADFFPLCPQYGAWSQASLQSNRENREHQKYFWYVIVLRGIKKQSGVRKLNGKQER